MSPKQLLSIILRRLWIIAFTLISTLAGAGAILYLVPARYDATATGAIDPGQVDPLTGQAPVSNLVRIMQGNLIALVKSQRVAEEVSKRLNLQRNATFVDSYKASDAFGRVDFNTWMADELLKSLDAKFTDGSNVISVTYKSPSPTQAATVANAFMSSLVDAAIGMKVNNAQQTATWFEPQMQKIRSDLDVARAKLAQFQRESKLLAPTPGSDSEASDLSATVTELSNARAQLVTLESQLAATAANTTQGTLDSQITDTASINSLKNNLASVTADIGKLQREVGENNPKLASLIAARNSLQQQIRAEIGANREMLQSKVKALRDQIQQLEKSRVDKTERMIAVQSQRDQLATLQREVEFRQAQVDTAARAAATARLQSQLSFSNISIVDNAQPPVSKAFPKTLVVVPIAAGLGIALGTILALLVEAFDRRIRAVSDLDFAVGAPVLGALEAIPSGILRRAPKLTSSQRQIPKMAAG